MASVTPYTEVITLYDIPGTTDKNAWSVNTWKTRFVLNYKKIPYKTIWLAYPDIKPTFERLGIKHTTVRKDGSLYHSVPAITDPHPIDGTGPFHVADSWDIALYLDKKYPVPPLFPNDTKGLQKLFVDIADDLLCPFKLFEHFILPGTFAQLTEESKPYFRRTREKLFGKTLEELVLPPGEKRDQTLKETKEKFTKCAGYMEGVMVMPPRYVYADLANAAVLMWIKVTSAEEVWPMIVQWDDGKWVKLLDDIEEKYGQVV